MADLDAAYIEQYEHIVPILRELTPEQLQSKVPFSPEWSVKDVAAHIASEPHALVGEAIPAGLFLLKEKDRAARSEAINAFNGEQLELRRTLSLDQILEDWAADVPVMLEALRGQRPFPMPYPGQDYVAVVDLAMHAQDIRNLVDRPGDRESAGVAVALPTFGFVLGQRITQVGLPSLELRYDGKSRVFGESQPRASMSASRYQLTPALASWRSTAQSRAHRLTGDSDPSRPIIPSYPSPDLDV